MPRSDVSSPGFALNDYLAACDQLLDDYAHEKISWATLFERREQVLARLNGNLIDHFLIRAHNRRELRTTSGERRDVRTEVRP